MSWFRVNVPGVGNIWVQAGNEQDARGRAATAARQQGVNLGDTDIAGLQAVASSGPQEGGFVVNQDGRLLPSGDAAITGSLGPTGQIGDSSSGTGGSTGSFGGSSTPGEAPGAVAPGPGEITPLAGAGLPVNTIGEQEFINPAAAFRSFAESQGLPTGGVLGNFLQGAAPESLLRDLGELRGAAQGAGGGVQDFSLGDYFSQNIGPQQGVLRGLGNAAIGDLRSIAGNPGALTSEPFTNVTDFGSEGASAVRRGALAGLTGRNPFFGSQFGNQLDQGLRRRFEDSVFQGEQPQNFINYALSNFGVG